MTSPSLSYHLAQAFNALKKEDLTACLKHLWMANYLNALKESREDR